MARLWLISLCLIFLWGCQQLNTVVLSDVDQEDANEAVLSLGKNSIAARKDTLQDGSYSVSVANKDELIALEVLKDAGVPQGKFASFGEVFKKDGYLSSPLEEHGRLIYALNQKIADMLSSIDGVTLVKAQVSIPMGDDSLWANSLQKSSASVLIKYRQGARIDMYSNRIKLLVSNSVPGLSPDRVEILMVLQKDGE